MTPPLTKESPGRAWPTGHSGWLFSNRAVFEGCATSFLAEGAERNERLMFVADDPRPRSWPKHLVERGELLIVSTREVYGSERTVHAPSQRAIFEVVLAEALREGYTGIRVAADNTSLVAEPDGFAAWMQWEPEAERFISEHPVTGMCGFERSRIDAKVASVLAGFHRVMVEVRRDRGEPSGGSAYPDEW